MELFAFRGRGLVSLGIVSLSLFSHGAIGAQARQIEEVVVTAERKESSVQDTSISITAFTGEFMEDFGIRNQSDLQNMVPATTIQPYDSAIRGVGRNFRNLGGDPGVSTYMNGVYSEDLYTATIGSFWDIDRIEVLRGPQGTLYGRNAVGGAMNFLYKKPTDDFEASLKTIIGSFGTRDGYGMVSGPLVDGILNSRLTVSSRRHDGWVEEKSGLGPDLDSGDELNIALQFEWLINDTMSINLRSNKAKVDRTFGGADGGGLIVLSGENTIIPGGGTERNYTAFTHSIRPVNPAETDPLSSAFVDPTQPVFNYTNPTTGAAIPAQRVRPGVDAGVHEPNYGRGLSVNPSACVISDRKNISGDDLCAFTNGQNVEIFDQQGNQLEFSWDLSDGVTFKYIFGYNELLYERITDDDSVGSVTSDRQFYVNHEAEYLSHEAQLFYDISDSLTFTSGLFFYDAVIDQRYDYYSTTRNAQFFDPNAALDSILATVAPGAVPGDPPLTYLFGVAPIDVRSAEAASVAANSPSGFFTIVTGPWLGDATLGSIPHGPVTTGSDFHGTNKTEREAFAAYTQGVWDINSDFTLTFGMRYAYDDIKGEESLAQYAESVDVLTAVGLDLATANILRGAINPATLQPTGLVAPWTGGVPFTFGAYRPLERKDEKVTWRINLDYILNEDSLIYANVTTGYRSGGFNLAFFSQTPQYEPEKLIAYELGYKARFFDNTLQFNSSAYFYDYSSIHTSTEQACPPGGTPQSLQSACAVVNSTTSVQAAPGAEVFGIEFEVLYLATENLTLGGNFSFTDTEYTKSFFVVDGADPRFPGEVYTAQTNPDRTIDIKGNRLLQVPELKANAFASYRFDLGDSGAIDVLASWSYIDDVYFSAFESDLDLAPAYDRFDLRSTWSSVDERWKASAFVNNVTDEIGIRQILANGAAAGYRRTAQVTEPRVYGLELMYEFR